MDLYMTAFSLVSCVSRQILVLERQNIICHLANEYITIFYKLIFLEMRDKMKKYKGYMALLFALALYSINSVAQEVTWKKIKVATIENIYDGTRYGWQYNETLKSFDIDNDGDNDILVGMTGDINDPLLPSDPLMYVIENLGNEEFEVTQRHFRNNAPLGWVNDLLIGDVNNDGKNDFIPVDHGRETGEYSNFEFAYPIAYLSDSVGLSFTNLSFEKTGREREDGKDFWHGGTNLRDINGDGNLDVVMTALSNSNLGIWTGNGDGTFADLTNNMTSFDDYLGVRPGLSNGIAGFIDSGNDGLQDIFLFPYATSLTFRPNLEGTLFKQDSSGDFSLQLLDDFITAAETEAGENLGFGAAGVYDFDQNGLEDIILVLESSEWKGEQRLVLVLQKEPDTFKDSTLDTFDYYSTKSEVLRPFPNPEYTNLRINGSDPEIALGDYNADGNMDFFVTIGKYGTWDEGLKAAIYYGDNKGNFSRNFDISYEYLLNETPRFDDASDALKIEGAADLNNDGVSDVFVMDRVYVDGEQVNSIYLLLSQLSNPGRYFTGTDANDFQSLNELSNVYEPFGGNDQIDGLGGIDIIKLQGNHDHWVITHSDEIISISHSTSKETKQLRNFERVQFSDSSYAFDENAIFAYKTLNLFLGKEYAQNPEYMKLVIDLSDSGLAKESITTQALMYVLGIDPNPEDVVQMVFRNLTGSDASDADLRYYAGLIRSGNMSSTEFLSMVLEHPFINELLQIENMANSGFLFDRR